MAQRHDIIEGLGMRCDAVWRQSLEHQARARQARHRRKAAVLAAVTSAFVLLVLYRLGYRTAVIGVLTGTGEALIATGAVWAVYQLSKITEDAKQGDSE